MMPGDSSGFKTEPPQSSADMSDAAKPAKQAKLVYCDTCGYSLNSQMQAAAHYTGKSHLKKMKQQKFGTQLPYKPRTTTATGVNRIHASKWATNLNPKPYKSRFSSFQSNYTVTSVEAQSYLSNDTPLGYHSFTSFQNNFAFQQMSPAADPVAKAVVDNFIGFLPKTQQKIVNCDVCNMTFNSDMQAAAHFQGAKHKRRVQLASGAGVVTPTPCEIDVSAPTEEKSSSSSVIWCDICHITVNSQKQLDAHVQGQSHKNKVLTSEVGKVESMEVSGHTVGWFFCDSCNISVSTPTALSQHVLSAEHVNKKQRQGSSQ